MGALPWLPANWNAHPRIRAGITTRQGGYSPPPFDSLNLAMHVGDNPRTVERNRRTIARLLRLPAEPAWLVQQHGCRIIEASSGRDPAADGSYSGQPGVVCAVLTADCVPLLLCNRQGSCIAAVHVGWKGYCRGIIGQALSLFAGNPADIQAWIGPHISRPNYEVGSDVRDACLETEPGLCGAFVNTSAGRWQAGLEQMIRFSLITRGVREIFSSDLCTSVRADDFFSYRRDGRTGRMAALIWIDKAAGHPPRNF